MSWKRHLSTSQRDDLVRCDVNCGHGTGVLRSTFIS